MGLVFRTFKARAWLACGFLALFVKLAIALTTVGTNDVITWHRFADSVDLEGPVWLYHADPLFNHPPFMTRVLALLNWLVQHTALPFPFWIRVPATLADLGSLYVMYLIVGRASRMLILLAICPISIFVSGFHGNTDPVMIFFVLLSIYFLEQRNWLVAAACAFGLAACIKVVPLVLAPAFVFYLRTNRRRFQFASVASATFVLLSLPYIVQDAPDIVRNVFGYQSLEGSWGFSHFARGLEVITHRSGYMTTADSITRVVMVVAITGLMMFLTRRSVSLFGRCALSMFLFLWLTPGFGIQYLAWLVPFALFFGEAWTVAVYATSSIFQFLVYTYWSQEFPWNYADAFTMGKWPYPIVPFEFIAWLTIGLALFACLRRIIGTQPLEEATPTARERALSPASGA